MANPITIEKQSDVDQAVVGQEILYTITVKNTTGIILNSVVVSDLLSSDLAFVNGSVFIDGVSMPLKDILSGVEIGPMGIGAIKNISFKATIVSKSGTYISNQSTVVYKYIEEGLEIINTKKSAPILILVEIAEVSCEKTADKTHAKLGDTIIYRVLLENTGTLNAYNVVYRDLLPETVELIPDSIFVDQQIVNNPNLEQGINIGTMLIDQTIEIIYTVKVTGGSCDGEIVNKGFIEYYYVLPNKVTGKKTSDVCTVLVTVDIVTFKQIMLDNKIIIPCQKPDIEEVDEVTAEIIIDDSYIIDTMKAVSNEAQQLTYHKLIIHGRIKFSIEYTALLCNQAMHSAHQEVPFSTFLVLPVDYEGQNIDVSSILEDVSFEYISKRSVGVGVVFLVVGQIK